MEFTKEELENEVWKDIPEYEGLYQVSDLGRIISMCRYDIFKDGTERYREGRMLKLANSCGYKKIALCKHSKHTTLIVHRLVLLAFEGFSELEVDHIDEVKDNNRLKNLRYCTNRENIQYHNNNKIKSSSYLGVTWSKRMQKWFSSICINRHKYHLGTYELEKDAGEIYIKTLYDWDNYGILPTRASKKTSQYKGISKDGKSEKWRAIYKKKNIGLYLTELEAYNALNNYLLQNPDFKL